MFREGLGQHLEQIKTLAPILICSMKIFIQILNQVKMDLLWVAFFKIEIRQFVQVKVAVSS